MFRTRPSNVVFGLLTVTAAIVLLFVVLALATWEDYSQFSSLACGTQGSC